MYQISDYKTLKAVPVILSGDVFLYYLSHVKQCLAYEVAINALCLWHKTVCMKAKLLSQYLSPHLHEELLNNVTEFQVGIVLITRLTANIPSTTVTPS